MEYTEGKEVSHVLMTDGTCKLKKKYNTTIISTSDGVKTIGLQHVAQENSEVLLNSSKGSLRKLGDIMSRVGEKTNKNI